MKYMPLWIFRLKIGSEIKKKLILNPKLKLNYKIDKYYWLKKNNGKINCLFVPENWKKQKF